jgi:hypothetical protein
MDEKGTDFYHGNDEPSDSTTIRIRRIINNCSVMTAKLYSMAFTIR